MTLHDELLMLLRRDPCPGCPESVDGSPGSNCVGQCVEEYEGRASMAADFECDRRAGR